MTIEPHRLPGVFVARGKDDALVTMNGVPGVSVYGEKRISIDVSYLLFDCRNELALIFSRSSF